VSELRKQNPGFLNISLNILWPGDFSPACADQEGLLDRSTARYFYKRLKTSLHKPTGNLLKKPFYRKCVFKNNIELLEKKFLSQTNATL
jgi:hypothetical protein